ncbi:MAG: MFS transporter [Planctomycetota bacterium]
MAHTTPSADHSLPPSQQSRNIFVFSVCTFLHYLAAPVLYVGQTQAVLCRTLGASPEVSNLPEIAFFVMTITPVILAWCLPGVAHLKRILMVCYLATGLALGLVCLALVSDVSNKLKIAAVILQGAVSGAAMPTAIALLWEAIGRGVSESRRGLALGLAFGLGPFLAVGPALLTQEMFTGKFWGFLAEPLPPPWNFVAVFGWGAPLMLIAAMISPLVVVPAMDEPTEREPFFRGLWEFLTTPLLAKATLVTILLYVGNTVTANMGLYTEFVLDADPKNYTGYQLATRFFCKGVAGLFLGWVLAKSNPRAGILITGLIFVASQIWALFVPGVAYLFAFGLFGAGELVGVYAPNYLLSASSPRRLRQNMAYVTMMMLPAAPAGYLFGFIATNAGLGPANNFRLSFVVCAGILIIGLILAVVLLPKRPIPEAATE